MTEILGTLRADNGSGVVSIAKAYDASIDEVWAAITDPGQLANWYGKVDGDLRQGGTYSLFVAGSGWEGTGRIDECSAPHRLVLTNRQSDESWQDGEAPYEELVDATLSTDNGQTLLTVEVGGLPLPKVGYYGAGWQLNLEMLAAHLAGQPLPGEDRFDTLVPSYLDQAAAL
jgi:uncharacterized protein YndB with AHSA1/START domain